MKNFLITYVLGILSGLGVMMIISEKRSEKFQKEIAEQDSIINVYKLENEKLLKHLENINKDIKDSKDKSKKIDKKLKDTKDEKDKAIDSINFYDRDRLEKLFTGYKHPTE